MDSAELNTITVLLRDVAQGDDAARERLYGLIYGQLNRLARTHLSRAGTISLDPSAIVHNAYMRMEAANSKPNFINRKIFFAYASTVMRNVIVDYVRERRALKRHSGERELTLDTGVANEVMTEDGLLHLHEALSILAEKDARCHQVVEMRYFAGLTVEEIAQVLDLSVPTIKRDWRKARAFLFDYLSEKS
jgi:RNA polymerase sigma factor (TIGR02999 family)